MHRSLSGVAPAAATLALCLLAPTAQGAGAPIMYLSEVRPGMGCTVASVVQGVEPTTFGATVLGVEGGPRPSDSLVIARFYGDAIKDSGIGQGFSGSPVTCTGSDGVPRVIGAISQGIGQYDNFVGGITPIEAMLATPTFGNAPSAPAVGEAVSDGQAKSSRRAATRKRSKAKAARSVAQPWGTGRTPLTLSGPRGPLATAFERAAAKAKFPLIVSPLATRAQTPAFGGLKPGDAVAVTTVSGDVSAGAIGTVTYVDGDRVWAFGHAFNGTGPARLTMERAAISAIISSPAIGDQVTYKLGSAVGPVGTIGFDGASAVGGVLGALPATIPVQALIRDGSGKVLTGAGAAVVDERPVRGGNTTGLLPVAAAANAGTALQRLTTQSVIAGSARTCTKIELKGDQKPLSECVDSVVSEPGEFGGVETGVAEAAASAVSGVTIAERFLRQVEGVHVDVTLRDEADSLEIVRVKQPSRVRAGRTATVRVVVVQGSTGDRREIPVKVRIPRSAAGERTGIVVLAGGAPAPDDAFAELFLDDGSGAGVPKTLDALRQQYTSDGLSGLRAVAVPGLAGSTARDLLTGDAEDSDLDEDELAELNSQVKLVYETPTFLVEGAASTTVRPR